MASVKDGAVKVETNTPDDTSIREVTPPGGSSDGEGSERTTREKLKKTSIAGLQQQSKATAGGAVGEHPLAESITIDQVEPPNENGGVRGRPSKKRSFEDLQKDEQTGPTENGSVGLPESRHGGHKRMRSRDVGHGDEPQQVGRLEQMGSPVQEESDDDAHRSPGGAGVLVDANSQTDSNAQADKTAEQELLEEEDTTNEPTVGVAAEPIATTGASVQQVKPVSLEQAPAQSQERGSSTLSPTSAFANASSASPFGSVKSPTQASKDLPTDNQDAPTTTSTSAFASSGLSAFASSEKSPFGAASTAKSSGGFGSGPASGFGSSTSGGFGSNSGGFGGTSTFGAKSSSGFGGGNSFGSTGGFGRTTAPKPFGASVSNFGGPTSSASTFGKPKPFGARDGEEDEEGEEGENSNDKSEQDGETRPDSRFHEQTVETGEEEEELIFQTRARLYHFEKEWKERGTGNLKINVRTEYKSLAENKDSEESEEQDPEAGDFTQEVRKARVVMRADGVHRVILNTPVFKGMKVGTNEGGEPVGKTMYLSGMEDGQPRLFQVKIGKEDVLKDLYKIIEELKEELE